MSEAKARLQAENEALRAKNDRLWAILKMPSQRRELLLAAIEDLIRSLEPAGEGDDYRLARTWHRSLVEALNDRIRIIEEMP